VDGKVKGRIWADQFVEFHTLISNSDKERIEFVESTNGTLVCKRSPQGSIRTMDQWFRAFHVFVAIYTAKFPAKAPLLMKYADTIQKLGKQAGDLAAFSYDRQFRLWREDQPDLLPWDQVNSELHNQALASGLCARVKAPAFLSSQNRQDKGKASKQKHCFRFNNSGSCPRQNCPFAHKCQKCDGNHSKKSCKKSDHEFGSISQKGGRKGPVAGGKL
ncbi:MAG: hypothetical protein ABW185_18190, partial [Sedimenticola sp.]